MGSYERTGRDERTPRVRGLVRAVVRQLSEEAPTAFSGIDIAEAPLLKCEKAMIGVQL